MRNLKKIAIIVTTALLGSLPLAYAHAEGETDVFSKNMDVRKMLDENAPKGAVTAIDSEGEDGDYSIEKTHDGGRVRILEIIDKMTQLAAVLALAGIVWAGWTMVTSNGDDEKAKQGKTALIWAAGGFAIAILAGPAVNLIVNFFFGTLG